MPLSEEEQRVFAEIERSLTSDRARSRRGGPAGPRRSSTMNAAVLGPALLAVAGLVLAGVTVSIHPLLVVAGFATAVFGIAIGLDRLGLGQPDADEPTVGHADSPHTDRR